MANRYIFAAQRIAEGHETAPEFTGDQVQERYVIFAVGRGLTQRQIELTMVQLDRHKALMVRLIRRTGLSVEG